MNQIVILEIQIINQIHILIQILIMMKIKQQLEVGAVAVEAVVGAVEEDQAIPVKI